MSNVCPARAQWLMDGNPIRKGEEESGLQHSWKKHKKVPDF